MYLQTVSHQCQIYYGPNSILNTVHFQMTDCEYMFEICRNEKKIQFAWIIRHEYHTQFKCNFPICICTLLPIIRNIRVFLFIRIVFCGSINNGILAISIWMRCILCVCVWMFVKNLFGSLSVHNHTQKKNFGFARSKNYTLSYSSQQRTSFATDKQGQTNCLVVHSYRW